MEEFITALKSKNEYEYIANHYHEMSNFDLRTILLEYIYFAAGNSDEEIIDSLEGMI